MDEHYKHQVQLFPFHSILEQWYLALRAWSGKRENESNAQQYFLKRAMANAAASKGEYIEIHTSDEARKNLHITGHDY